MPPHLVFLHGLESGPRGSKYRTLTDLGLGPVDAPDCEGVYDPDLRFGAIEAALAGRDRLLLVGSSFGGLMALRFAAARPEQVAGLVLCAPAVHRAAWPVPDVRPGLPVRVLHGDQDATVPLAAVEAFCRRNGLPLRVVADEHRLQASHHVLAELVREVHAAVSSATRTTAYPPGVVLHVPHDSTLIPDDVRGQFVLDDEALRAEVIRMTDHRTLDLFRRPEPGVPVVAAPVSRLVVDVERFEQDAREPMAAKGMGVVYRRTSDGRPLRRPLSGREREALLATYYRPHHQRLEAVVDGHLLEQGRALIIDCHSFPGVPLPYEPDQDPARPEICIGTDRFHTPDWVEHAFVAAFGAAGFTVAVNRPYSGALVPMKQCGNERRVWAVMVEVNRDLYLEPGTAEPLPTYPAVADRVRDVCRAAASAAMEARAPHGIR